MVFLDKSLKLVLNNHKTSAKTGQKVILYDNEFTVKLTT